MGAVPKVRIGGKTLFLSRLRTLKKKSLQDTYDSVTNTGNAFLYGLQKYDLKYGLSVHIKIKGRFKSQFYMQNTIFFLITNIEVICFARFVISLREMVYLHIICGNM